MEDVENTIETDRVEEGDRFRVQDSMGRTCSALHAYSPFTLFSWPAFYLDLPCVDESTHLICKHANQICVVMFKKSSVQPPITSKS